MYKAKDLRDQSLEELESLYDESCKKLFALINDFRAQMKKDKPHQFKELRKDIARMLTVISQKRREQQS